MLFVFKVIFLVVFAIGGLIVLCAPVFYPNGKNSSEVVRNRKVTRLRLIGVIIACIGLLVVIILANIK